MKKLILIISLCLVAVLFSGCALGSKSWGSAGSTDAFKITPSDMQSGNYAPTIVAGGGAHAMAFQKAYDAGLDYPTIFTYSRRKSMWGVFSGDTGSANISIVYIAGSKETSEDTIKILNSFAGVVNPPKDQIETTKKE